MIRRSLLSSFLLLFLLLAPLPEAQAEEGTGVVSVKQLEHLHLGNWTLTTGAGIVTQGSFDEFSSERPAGNYAIIVTPPAGAEAVIEVRNSAGEMKTFKSRTATGILPAGGTLDIDIDYSFSRVGDFSVGSNPMGLAFEAKTPWGIIKGKTPFLEKGMPEGTYAVQYLLPKGCKTPPWLSEKLLVDGRISFEFSPVCALLGTGNAAAPKTMQEVSRMSMRSKLAQRLSARKTAAVPARLATTGRRVMSLDDPEHCHNEEALERPLKRRD